MSSKSFLKSRRPHPDLVVDASVLGVLVKVFLRVDGDLVVEQPLPDLVRARRRFVTDTSDLPPVGFVSLDKRKRKLRNNCSA